MRIDVSARGEGKTTRALRWLLGDLDHRVLIVHNVAEERRIIEHLKSLESFRKEDIRMIENRIHQFSCIEDNELRGTSCNEIWIDNVDLCLSDYLCGIKLAGMSMTP